MHRRRHRPRVTADELMDWLRTDTPYPNPSPTELLANDFLVVHEIVEIDEAKKMGLRITKDVIVRNMDAINVAHLRAAQVEFTIAASEGAADYLESRYRDLEAWCDDPLLRPDLKKEYEAFRADTREALERLRRKRPAKR